jgi:glutamyl-tRNA synthetase
VVEKRWNEKSPLVLQDMIQSLQTTQAIDAGVFEKIYNDALAKAGVAGKDFLQLLRVCLSGVAGGPPIFEMAALFGKESTLRRLKHALDTLSK